MTVAAVETAAGRLRDLRNERVPDMLIVAAASVRSRRDRQNRHKRTRDVREARVRRPTENPSVAGPKVPRSKGSQGNSVVPSRSRRFLPPANDCHSISCVLCEPHGHLASAATNSPNSSDVSTAAVT